MYASVVWDNESEDRRSHPGMQKKPTKGNMQGTAGALAEGARFGSTH